MTAGEPAACPSSRRRRRSPEAAAGRSSPHSRRDRGARCGHWPRRAGSTAPGIYRRPRVAAAASSASPGTRVHMWWGDDRFVPADDPLSNVCRWRLLLAPTTPCVTSACPVAAANLHPWPIAAGPRGGRGPGRGRGRATRRRSRPSTARRMPTGARRSTSSSSASAPTATCSRSSRGPPSGTRRAGAWPSRRRPTSSPTSSG